MKDFKPVIGTAASRNKWLPARLRIEPKFVRLTQVNGHTGMVILVRISSIISISPMTLDPLEGSFVMLAGDQRPIKVSEPYGMIASKLGIKAVVSVEEE
jgi:hypothetical protein